MIKIGITGGIGSGKSLVCQVFHKLGIPVYYADEEAKRLTYTDEKIKNGLIALFGNAVFINGELNRSLLAQHIFSDRVALEQVNKIIHPRVMHHFEEWSKCHEEAPYILHESAILFESLAFIGFEKIICVFSSPDLRTDRVMKRKGMTLEKFKAIMNNQIPEEDKMRRSDFVLWNDEKQLVIPQVLKIHNQILNIR